MISPSTPFSTCEALTLVDQEGHEVFSDQGLGGSQGPKNARKASKEGELIIARMRGATPCRKANNAVLTMGHKRLAQKKLSPLSNFCLRRI